MPDALATQQVELVHLHCVAQAVDGDDDRQPERRLRRRNSDDEQRERLTREQRPGGAPGRLQVSD